MSATNWSDRPAFTSTAAAFQPAISHNPKNKSWKIKPLLVGKYSKFTWALVLLYIYTSYNSCHVEYAEALIPVQRQQYVAAIKTQPIKAKAQPAANHHKTIYFTFDDGPNLGTSNVLNILNREQIPATFFLVGAHVFGSRKQLDIYQKLLADSLVETANHSFYHAKNKYKKFYQSPAQVLADFQLMRDSVKIKNHLARTPGRNVWRTSRLSFDINQQSVIAADLLKANNYTLIGWDVEWKVNAKKQLDKTPEALIQEIDEFFKTHQTKTSDHLVILMHDQNFLDNNNLQALEDFISAIKKTGTYRFERVSKYPGV